MNPASHDAHFSAPMAGQAAPVCPTPFLHTHPFPMQSKSIETCTSVQPCICQPHSQSNKRTNALCAIVTDCEPKVARRAFGGTACRTTHASFRRAVMACAHFHCQIEMHQSPQYYCECFLTHATSHCDHLQTTHNQAHVRIHLVLS